MSRTRFAAAALALLLVASPIASAAVLGGSSTSPYDGKLSGQAADIKSLGGYSVPDSVVTGSSHADPHWYVHLTNDTDAMSSITEWANESSRREVLMQDNASKLALVRAPPASVLGGLMTRSMDVAGTSVPSLTLADGLKTRAYVEAISVEQIHEVAPITDLQDESEHAPPVHDALIRGSWSTEGVAFGGDVNTTLLGDVRRVTGADAVSERGAGVTAAVCDTGLNVDNVSSPALYGSRIISAKEFVGANSDGLANVSTTNYHGPWTVAAVGANATNDSYDGLAPDANLVVGKALDDDGSGSTEDIRECIAWAESQDSDVLSLSLGSPVYSPVLADAIKAALAGNLTAVYVAAGNSRNQPVGRYINSPADVPKSGVLTVGATDTATPENASTASFSSVAPDGGRDLSNGVTVGQGIDLAAPGMEISAPIFDHAGYRTNHTLSGTSMATPIAAGIGVLQLGANPGLENDTADFADYARNTSSAVPGAGVTEVGHGMVNASNSVALSPSETDHASARTDDAQARDAANEAYSGAWWLQRVASVTSAVGV